jgi:DNA polymerase III delta prime subunit
MTRLNFSKLPDKLIKELMVNICEFEGILYTPEVITYITERAEGIPRDALGYLKMIDDEGTWSLEAAKELITGSTLDEDNPQIIELARALNKQEWRNSLKIFDGLKNSKGFSYEAARLAISGYFTACLKRSKTLVEGKKYSTILDILNAPIYDTGKTAENKFYNYLFKVIDSTYERK